MKRQKKTAIGLVVIITATLFAGFVIANNLNSLFLIANGSDQPSKTFYFTITQIFKKIDKSSCDDIVYRLGEEKYSYLHDLYIYVLGFAGYDGLKEYMEVAQTQCLEKPGMKSTCIRIVNAMGVSGDTSYIKTLESFLEKEKNINLPTKYYVSRSLYLLTGKKYQYSDDGVTLRKFIITDDLKKAHDLVSQPKGDIRTYDNTLALEKLFRPPSEAPETSYLFIERR